MRGFIQFSERAVQSFRPLAPGVIYGVAASFPPKCWGPTEETRRSGPCALGPGSLGSCRSIGFSLPGGLRRGRRHVVCGLNSTRSKKAVGEGWEGGNAGPGEEATAQPQNLA